MPKNKSLSIVIDTNIWISFLISKRQDQLDKLLLIKKISLFFSKELLEEINATINKPKLKKHFGTNALEEMLSNIEAYKKVIEVNSIVTICRDPKDNFLLALAKDSNAHFLITGDKDLLTLQKFGSTSIVTIAEFIELNNQF